MQEKTREELNALLRELLKGKAPADLDGGAIGRKATYRAERKQPLEAAVLFEAAAARLLEDGDRDSWLEDYVRAGLEYFEAGDLARAVPILRNAIDAHREVPGHRDAHMVEWCYTLLLRFAAHEQDRSAFRALFAEAIEQCAAVGRPGYPRIHPHQEQLLEAAHALGCEQERRSIADHIYARRPISRALRARLKKLDLLPR